MLDTFSKYLLDYIKNKGKGEFLVVELKDVLTSYPKPNSLDENTVLTALENLNNSGYITLKYNDGKLFCVGITEKGKNYEETQHFSFKRRIAETNGNLGWVLFSAFLGGFFGCVLFNFLKLFFV